MSSLTADHYFWCSGGVPGDFDGVPGCSGCTGFYRHPELFLGTCVERSSVILKVTRRDVFDSSYTVHSSVDLTLFYAYIVIITFRVRLNKSLD